MQCYFGDDRPALPSEDEKLWELADADNLKEWNKHKDAVLKNFTQTTIENGAVVLRNKRVDEEWARQLDHLEKKSHAGKASAESRQARVAGKIPPHPPKTQDTTLHNTTLHKNVEHNSTDVQQVLTGVEVAGEDPRSVPSGIELSTMGNLQRVSKTILGEKMKVLSGDARRAEKLEQGYGRQILELAWAVWLLNEDNRKMPDGTDREGLLRQFLESGDGELLAEEIKPLVARGFSDPSAIEYILGVGLEDETKNLSQTEISLLEAHKRWNTTYCQFLNTNKNGTLKEYVSSLIERGEDA
jgi:uncharacterized protein YdaU (DUF1376 family)